MLRNRERVGFSVRGDTVTAYLRGEIDHHSASELRRELDDYISRHRPRILRLDASQVAFMDSSGLGLMMGRYALMQRMGGELILCRPTPSVLRMVSMAGMERIIKIETT